MLATGPGSRRQNSSQRFFWPAEMARRPSLEILLGRQPARAARLRADSYSRAIASTANGSTSYFFAIAATSSRRLIRALPAAINNAKHGFFPNDKALAPYHRF